MALVSLADAKRHLRVVDDDSNADVQQKVDHASAIVLDYLGTEGDDDWTPDTAPAHVQAVTLMLLTHLHENRGDDMKTDEDLWSAVHRYLVRTRTPSLA